ATAGEDEATSLHRFDGQTWTEALTGLAAVESMIEDGADLLLATVAGLRRMPLFPADGDPFSAGEDPDELAVATHALLRAADGTVYVGTAAGLSTLGPGDALTPFVLGADEESAVEVFGLHQDATGTLHIGCELGLLRYQPGLGHWYWYRGEERSDQHPDWDRFDPDANAADRNFPSSDDVFLPPVRCVHRGPDASLWIGTERGIARYVAAPVRGLTYTTLLQAYPELGESRVSAIREDERGMMWFATGNGLFRFDGRDWWQMQADALVRLPTPGPAPPRQWRFNRALDRWESFDTRSSLWSPFTGTVRATDEDAVLAMTWTDDVAADLGSWDGTNFSVDAEAEVAPLRMRYKPVETRIVGGGIPAIPRIPPTPSVWRYLSLEQEPVLIPASAPAWTIEGRLLPPPPSRAPVLEGRYSANAPLDLSQFDEAAFAFNPAARIWMSWDSRHPLAVLVRLRRLEAGERIDPAILDRVWQGIEMVRPAGVRTVLAVDEEVVRGGSS
ncbi:MAG TPA: hypothetical protein VMN39_12325, partial [Longimicrobiaceae bacterium]|nr:hypothetical protein [Longimicrobiaceae bacterium]